MTYAASHHIFFGENHISLNSGSSKIDYTIVIKEIVTVLIMFLYSK